MVESNKTVQGTSGWKPNFNGVVHCPWASNAPLTATTSCKNGGKCSESCHVPPRGFSETFQSNSKINPWFSRNKPTITYFNNFVRLMQLFPEMHPASLHAAMSICKNDFISTVDRLLYVRRMRNGAFYRKEGVQNITKKIHRRMPHMCGVVRNGNSPGNDEIKIVGNGEQTQIGTSDMENGDCDVVLGSRKFQVNRLVYNNKAKMKCSKTDPENLKPSEKIQQMDVTPEDNIPITAQDLSQTNLTCS